MPHQAYILMLHVYGLSVAISIAQQFDCNILPTSHP